MTTDRRPLSPHIGIYRPQITSVLSITHRGTGLVLAFGSVLLAWWLSAVAAGGEAYLVAHSFFGSVGGRIALLAIAYSFFFHLCNGVRHLFWDAGKGVDMPSAHRSGWGVIIASLIFTLLSALGAYGLLGGGA